MVRKASASAAPASRCDGSKRLRSSVEDKFPSMKVMPRSMASHWSRGPNLFNPVGSPGLGATSYPGRFTTKKSNSCKSLSPVTTSFLSSGSPGFHAGFLDSHVAMFVPSCNQSVPMTKTKSTSGWAFRKLQRRSYVNIASGSKHSMSLTLTGKLGENVELTAIWHITYRSIGGVFNLGLSGRLPHGTSQTSSAFPLWTISEAHVKWEFVMGS
mmetsp:Transcript_8445/g.24193  ORF Transcript_8445/g.24193 Transcript_8445/m.24193 type:complete len:212 (-) Transcript_8445:154-789(-)